MMTDFFFFCTGTPSSLRIGETSHFSVELTQVSHDVRMILQPLCVNNC